MPRKASGGWSRRLAPRDGRVTADTIAAHPYAPGALAFVCGPDRYDADIVALLRAAGWPTEAIRIEVFSSKVDDEGNVRAAPTPKAATRGDVVVPPAQHTSFFLDLRDKRPVLLEAEAFLGQMYRERGLESVLQARLEEVREELGRTGTYTHTLDELTFGARLAWRNATRCVGRFFWNHLVVRDMRHLEREEDIFAAIVDHIRLATNGGDLISTMTVLRPRRTGHSHLQHAAPPLRGLSPARRRRHRRPRQRRADRPRLGPRLDRPRHALRHLAAHHPHR